jgi:hypothetical protein
MSSSFLAAAYPLIGPSVPSSLSFRTQAGALEMLQHSSPMLHFRRRKDARERQHRHLQARGTIKPGAVTLETQEPPSRVAAVLLVMRGAGHPDPPLPA